MERLVTLKEKFNVTVTLERRGTHALWGCTSVGGRETGGKGSLGQSPPCGLCGEGKAGQERCTGLASLNHSGRSGVQGLSLLAWHLALGHLGQGKYWFGV